MINFDDFSKITDCIEFHCLNNPSSHCFSLQTKGEWTNFTRKEFWDKVLYYEKFFLSHFSEVSLILFIKEIDFDLMASYIGCIKAGLIPAQISHFSPKVSQEEYNRKMKHIIKITNAKGIFGDSFFIEKLPENTNAKLLIPSSPRGTLETKPIDNDIAIVQFSSGSTGLQKGVKISHKALISHKKAFVNHYEITDEIKIASWLPLYHDLGLLACYLFPLMFGIPFFQIPPFDWIMNPNLLLEVIEKEKIGFCTMPNFAFNLLVKKGKTYDLSSIKYFVSSSEPVNKITMEKFAQKFPTLNPDTLSAGYGLAENTMSVALWKNGKKYGYKFIHGKEVTSCGDILENTQVKIFHPDEEGVGEIGVKGDSLFDGFINAESNLIDGYYLTGDLGLVENNQVYVTGRKKDIIIVNGKNVYPQDVETATSNVEGVYTGRVVAFGIFNEKVGSEELFVIAETRETVDNNVLKIEINKAVEFEIGLIPKKVEIVPHKTLVKTSSGKISRSRNKELYLNNELKLL